MVATLNLHQRLLNFFMIITDAHYLCHMSQHLSLIILLHILNYFQYILEHVFLFFSSFALCLCSYSLIYLYLKFFDNRANGKSMLAIIGKKSHIVSNVMANTVHGIITYSNINHIGYFSNFLSQK